MTREKRDESAPPLPFLPCDLILNILSWLPVKSILRFKCVCKSWLTLFTNPDFVKKHLSQSQNHKLIVSCEFDNFFSVTCENHDPRPIRNINSEIRGLKVNILGSCDGLVLNGTGADAGAGAGASNRLYLLNPTTEKFNRLPVLPSPIEQLTASYGFGYDASIDDYKVVAISSSLIGVSYFETITSVYTLKTNSWRRIQVETLEVVLPIGGSAGILLHGVLHWLRPHWSNIVCFDLVQEKFQYMPLPADLQINPSSSGLTCGVLRGCLCISFIIQDQTNTKFSGEFWVMKEYGKRESWTNIWSTPAFDSIKSLNFSNSDKEDLFLVNKKWLDGYNVEKNSLRRYPANYSMVSPKCEAEIYLESMVSP
ncbi:F-box/kelch-repeat protein At3g06240-like [Cornus florida]|uniref:F-box/kelch-repeat protein At3g06240-like n=1 Tax=Cornus florida TaxID=4283 RepID=UPI0028A1E99F|nr:F-box/kelch-repeat protein At3g06240-like [Cornus florida]